MVFGIQNFGKALAWSLGTHVVVVALFLSMGSSPKGKDKEAAAPEETAEPASAETTPENVGAPDAKDAVEPGPPAEEVSQPVRKPETKKPEAKKPEAKKPESRKEQPRKPEAKKPEAQKEQPKKDEAKSPEAPREQPKKDDAKKPVAATAASDPGEAPGEWKTYEVRAGDSLTKLARKCGCTLQELAKANGLTVKTELQVGQKIKIKVSD